MIAVRGLGPAASLAGRGLLYALVFASLVVMLFPIAWMISTSLKSGAEIFVPPPRWIARAPTLDGYRVALGGAVLGPLFNSLLVATGAALLATGAGSLCAYGVSRMRFRGRHTLMAVMLATLGLPIPLLMLTLYVMFSRAGVLDSYLGLILGHTAITLPVVVWMLKVDFDALPQDVEEAAYIDGAGLLYTFWRIVLPMAAPGLAAAAIFVFVTSWNELVFGMTFVSTASMRPLPAAISLLFLGEFQYRWGDAMAVAVIVTLPVMLLFVFCQRFFIQGITAGAVKS